MGVSASPQSSPPRWASWRPAAASAHPLGNSTINHYAGVEVAGSDNYVRYALDVAEHPNYFSSLEIRSAGHPARLARDLHLTLYGRRVPLLVVRAGRSATWRRRSEDAPAPTSPIALDGDGTEPAFRDADVPERIGWREVTVTGRDGGRVSSTVRRRARATCFGSTRGSPPIPVDVSSASATIDLGLSLHLLLRSTPSVRPGMSAAASRR